MFAQLEMKQIDGTSLDLLRSLGDNGDDNKVETAKNLYMSDGDIILGNHYKICDSFLFLSRHFDETLVNIRRAMVRESNLEVKLQSFQFDYSNLKDNNTPDDWYVFSKSDNRHKMSETFTAKSKEIHSEIDFNQVLLRKLRDRAGSILSFYNDAKSTVIDAFKSVKEEIKGDDNKAFFDKSVVSSGFFGGLIGRKSWAFTDEGFSAAISGNINSFDSSAFKESVDLPNQAPEIVVVLNDEKLQPRYCPKWYS